MSTRRSSSRSSQSTSNTLRVPKWKTSGLFSSQPATSISKVFAQPLQGSPLRSAIDQLPAHAVSVQDDTRSTVGDDDSSVKQERASVAGEDEHESLHTLAEEGGSCSVSASSAVSVALKEEDSQDTKSKSLLYIAS